VKEQWLRTDRFGGSFAEKELGVLVVDRSNTRSSAPAAVQAHRILGQVRTSVTSREVMLLLYAASLRPQMEDWQEKHQHTGASLGTDL